MCIRIKDSETDPCRKGCFIHIGAGRHPLRAVHASVSYLALRGDAPGPLFLFQNGQPALSHNILTDWLQLRCWKTSPPTAFTQGLLLLQLAMEYLTI